MTISQNRGMMGTLKSFDRAEHSVLDEKGKNAFIGFLNKANRLDLRHIENPNKYGIDVLTLDKSDKVVACWEIEVRYGNWKGNVPFPFDEINCIERKDYQWRRTPEFTKKIPFDLAKNYDVWYVQLNDLCTRAVLINGDTILKYPLKQWANRKAQGEYVRQVPISQTKQVVL